MGVGFRGAGRSLAPPMKFELVISRPWQGYRFLSFTSSSGADHG
jgi:hypothetical protein